MVPTLYTADTATAAAAAAGGFYNQTAFVPQLAVAQMPQVYTTHLTTCNMSHSSLHIRTNYCVYCVCYTLDSFVILHLSTQLETKLKQIETKICFIFVSFQTPQQKLNS